jgi:hypothetical protein
MISINNRLSPRYRMHGEAVILLPAGYINATVLDISLTGALIEIANLRRVPRGGTCALRLLSDNGRQLVEVEAAVVRYAGDRHIGLKTCNLSPGAYGVLSRLIETASYGDGAKEREVCALLRRVDPAHLKTVNTVVAEAPVVHQPVM